MRRARAVQREATLLSAQSGVPTPRVRVSIEAPESNRRLVSACNLINAPLETVWQLLSDYSNLATHIPNLVMSERRMHPNGGIRVEQCGAQSILGFQFRASLVMDMTEVNASSSSWRAINFDLVSSRDFRQFEGVWRMEMIDDSKTALYYTVSIVPKGLVPVKAIEWRISEDVPENMDAVRLECERRRRLAVSARRREQLARADKSQLL
ncbi:Polyketide cyclase [Gracilaria domingensis]|nr:Polyketide cyclase [Gracilaria domingensis]